MRYELIGQNDYLNPIKTVLKNRGIEDIQSFLNLKENVTHDWRLLDNIDLAAKTLINYLDQNIFIQVDEDNDGYFSSAILYNYLKKYKSDINIVWRVHEKKMHGIIPSTVPENINLVIIPDAGSNQYKEHKELRERGIEVIVLDHHQCEKESEDAIVVNNQLSKKYPNKQFSGCGIVYKFCKALDHYLNVDYADEYLDLLAIGNIADSMSTREPETRYYIQQGLKKIKNPLVKAIIDKNEYTLKGKVTIKDVSWTISPLINSATRVGTVEERMNMFKALTNHKEKIYNSRKKEDEELIPAMARILSNIRGRQNRKRENGEKLLIERIEEKKLNDNKFIIVDATEIIEPSLSGVVAIKICEKYRKPTLVFRISEDGETLGGSARGYDKSAVKDLRSFLNETGQFIFCEGHPQAHGFSIEPEKLITANNIINEKLRDVEMGVNIHYVDFVLKSNQLSRKIIEELNKYKDVWGKDVEEPLILVTEVEINSEDIMLQGKKKNTIKFVYQGIEFIKFYTGEEEYNSLINKGERLKLEIVGKANMNSYNGKTTPQIEIEDYEVTKTKKKEFVF